MTSPQAAPPTAIPQPGQTAPDATLPSTAGDTVRISQFFGKENVLLAFFPLAFTSTCTTELCAFTDDFDAFGEADVRVLPISVDAVPSLKEFKSKFSLQTDLLSDFKREASRAYGVLRDDTYFSNRAYFLIDKQGIVRWTYVEDTPGSRRENAEILDAIRRSL